ncbi:mitochondrial uncoupling protein 4-like [Halichondria panicea]|uniref:mitochondrial uncoupling protein 4-like n=1 Tax=Halichondria panicea TaxID=6063 RepID=UPI00312BC711
METPKRKNSYVAKYLLTITASSVAETVTFPMDMIKTRLQIQGQDTGILNKSVISQDTVAKSTVLKTVDQGKYRGVVRTAIGIAREEGVLKLWRGLPPAVLRHCIYSGCRMTFYEVIRDHIFKRNKDGTYPLWKAVPSGMIAGAGGQFIASPTDRVKVLLQMEGRRVLDGHKPRYRGMWHVFTSIARTGGVAALWKGWVPNCTRSSLVCLGDLTTYDAVKQRLLKNKNFKDTAITHAMSSICSSITSALMGTPADVIKSRMMNQPYNEQGVGQYYKSTIDCLLTTVKGEGVLALYKGLIPIWARMAPWSMTFWLVYEEIRVLAGVGNF